MRSPAPRFVFSAFALTALLVIEVSVASIALDTAPLDTALSWLARIFASAPDFLSVLLAVVGATALVAVGQPEGEALRERLRQATSLALTSDEPARQRVAWLALHLAAFVAFLWAARRLLEAAGQSQSAETIWLTVSLATFALTGLAFAAAAVSPRVWPELLRIGRPVLALAAVVAFGSWLLGTFLERLWRPLLEPTFAGVEWILTALGQRVWSDPSQLFLGVEGSKGLFWVEIHPSCSGYQGIGLILVFLSTYLWFFRRELRFPAALVLLPIGALALWLANLVRIAALIMIGAHGSTAVAMGGFHSQAGWLSFIVISLGLVVLARKSRLFSKRDAPGGAVENPTVPYLVPFLGILLAAFLVAALTEQGQLAPVWRVMIAVLLLALCWRGRWRELVEVGSGSGWAVAVGALVAALWLVTDPRFTGGGLSLAGTASSSLSGVVVGGALAISYVLITPIVEELAFRGFLARRLTAVDFDRVLPRDLGWIAILVSSLLFGFLHERWLAAALAGVAFALVYRRSGRLFDAVLAHATTNGLLAIAAFVTGSPELLG